MPRPHASWDRGEAQPMGKQAGNPRRATTMSTGTAEAPDKNATAAAAALLSSAHSRSITKEGQSTDNNYDEDHPDLAQLEQRLTEDVDEEFFQDPRRFHTLHRVIDVLGMQLMDNTLQGDGEYKYGEDGKLDLLQGNPAYMELREQHAVVEEAIEHLALIHCADLNGSVVQVGRVARQFQDARTQVRRLRQQVGEIQETLGAQDSHGTAVVSASQSKRTATASSAMSLRELWLHKLECEATLELLRQFDTIRAAPRTFDMYLEQHRVGAAVLHLASALDTMFSQDVSQVQALHKIMEQLMLRKQKAEEVVWESLADVIGLRTGVGTKALLQGLDGTDGPKDKHTADTGSNLQGPTIKSTSSIVSEGSKHSKARRLSSLRASMLDPTRASRYNAVYQNPFWTRQLEVSLLLSWNSLSDTSFGESDKHGGLNLLSDVGLQEDIDDDDMDEDGALGALQGGAAATMVLPLTLIEAEFDLEAEERRCLDEMALFNPSRSVIKAGSAANRPTYPDAVLALRILVESIAQLGRLGDVERLVQDMMDQEIPKLVQRQQLATCNQLQRWEKMQVQLGRGRRSNVSFAAASGMASPLYAVRKHLQGLLSAFGCALLRLSHFAQIVRYRLSMEKATSHSSPSSALQSVIVSARQRMEQEIRHFIEACLTQVSTATADGTNVSGSTKGSVANSIFGSKQSVLGRSVLDGSAGARSSHQQHENGIFRLGILHDDNGLDDKNPSSTVTMGASGAMWVDRSTPDFVAHFLLPATGHAPEVRHALEFRKPIALWTKNVIQLRKELAAATGEDTSPPSNKMPPGESALNILDQVIQNQLLPVLQEEAVDGTVRALERLDAFDPVLDRNVFSNTAGSNDPADVDMCKACAALAKATGPLFLALHRLPNGGDMYLPLVAVLEHVILTFISRVKQQVAKICNGKTAQKLQMDTGATVSKVSSSTFGHVMERRRAFTQLVMAYAGDSLAVETESVPVAVSQGDGQDFAMQKVNPPSGDTPRSGGNSDQVPDPSKAFAIGGGEGIDHEEEILGLELQFLKPFLNFASIKDQGKIVLCQDEELIKAAGLAHSLLRLSSLLERRLQVRRVNSGRGIGSGPKTLSSTRALQEAIKTIKANGLKMAKFCRAEMLLQTLTRLSKVCFSSTLVARDAVRIPSSVHDLGEYMAAASDNMREAAGNAVAALAFSSLEQYIPLCLIQTVRVLAAGEGIIPRAPLTMNGIEALDRSGSVLYRDLKAATSFDNSFWDIELAAVSFERSASFMAMMELEMSELEAYYQANHEDFSASDFELMFSMNGPRRKGDIGRYHMLQRRMNPSG